MEVINSIAEIKDVKFSLTIGNFDGVHLGHQEILKTIKAHAESRKEKFVVMTFIPHPSQILSPRNNFLINSYAQRRQYLKDLGVDYLVEIEFNRDLSTLGPAEFMDNYILANDGLSDFFLGHDFAFGSNKSGDHNFIEDYCSDKHINVHILKKFIKDSKYDSISSSTIRNEIDQGNISEANVMLGRGFMLSGTVVKGVGRGKQIGIPTANMGFDVLRKIPCRGVYTTQIKVNNQLWNSITNVGFNPTFNNNDETFVETHILDFDNDIYGQEIEVYFISKIRDEKKFSNVNELIKQINADIQEVRTYFGKN